MADFKTIRLRPMTGVFDTLSSADEVGYGNWRVVKNAITRSTRNRERGGGWRRLFADDVPYNNQDLHDQLTNRLGYYESFDGHAFSGGSFDGYSYAYFTGTYLTPTEFGYPEPSGPFAPVYIGDFPELFYGPCPIFYPYVGYPYVIDPRPDLYDHGVTTGDPDFYVQSYVYTACQVEYPGDIVSGYPYGPSFPMYSPSFNYDYTVCGDYLYNRPGCREAVTLLSEVVTDTGRKLLAGTMSRVYEFNQSAGNWRVLADGLGNSGYTIEQCGCNAVRGTIATLGTYVIFTNNFDPPSIYFLGDEPSQCELQALLPITDLAVLGITRAGGVVTWKGFVIFFDITEDSVRMGGTVLWSDLENPHSFIESDTSFAGRATVAVGETILAAAPIGNWLILYTDKSIIRVSLVGGEDVFNFERIYQGGNALKYKYSLINTGDSHIYMGQSDIYVFTQFDTRPINIDWITKAAGMVFAGITEDDAIYAPINEEACDLVTGGWNEMTREAFMSWPTGDSICPTVTLRLNIKFGTADFIDHGFSAFLSFYKDIRPTIGEWIEDMGICPPGSKVATGIKDGRVCQAPIGLPYIEPEPEEPEEPEPEPDDPEVPLELTCGSTVTDREVRDLGGTFSREFAFLTPWNGNYTLTVTSATGAPAISNAVQDPHTLDPSPLVIFSNTFFTGLTFVSGEIRLPSMGTFDVSLSCPESYPAYPASVFLIPIPGGFSGELFAIFNPREWLAGSPGNQIFLHYTSEPSGVGGQWSLEYDFVGAPANETKAGGSGPYGLYSGGTVVSESP